MAPEEAGATGLHHHRGPCLPKSPQEVGVEGSLGQWAETTDGSHEPTGLEGNRPATCGPLMLSSGQLGPRRKQELAVRFSLEGHVGHRREETMAGGAAALSPTGKVTKVLSPREPRDFEGHHYAWFTG